MTPLESPRRLPPLAFTALLSSVAACASTAPAQAPEEPAHAAVSPAERYLPLLNDTVFSYDTSSEDTGERGGLVLSILRPRAGMAELRVGESVQRLELEPDGIRHAAGGWLLKQPVRTGATFRGQFGTVEIVSTNRSIVVPAGSFTECVETKEEARLPVPKRTTSVFCPGVGMVFLEVVASTEEGPGQVRSELRWYGERVDISAMGDKP